MKRGAFGSLALALLGCSAPGQPALRGEVAPPPGAPGAPVAPVVAPAPSAPAEAPPPGSGAPTPAASAPDAPGPRRLRLGGCVIELGEVFVSRDWMPEVYRPGKDGGTPLRGAILFTVRADGPRGCAPRATAMLASGTESMGHVDLVIPGMGTVFLGEIAPGASLELGARALDGPYLAPHTKVWLSLALHDRISGEQATIRTGSVLIDTSS